MKKIKRNAARCNICDDVRCRCGAIGTDATDYAWFAWGSEKKGIFHL